MTSEHQQQSKLKWRCRRGMRELDDLLMAYLEHRYGLASAGQKAAFEALLTLPDPELAAYLLKKQEPESAAIAEVIRQILQPDRA